MGQIAKCRETVVLIIVTIIIVSSNKKIFFEKFPAQIGYFGQGTSPSQHTQAERRIFCKPGHKKACCLKSRGTG
ncbi:MAG: hypothetical protein A2W19_11070 [Spirochaetes bacterium RBG_16_49_21]|nr:MAG: hypothetical protein A2W19_11070 [Spirochaetes bacterium RBG_16_49_21]